MIFQAVMADKILPDYVAAGQVTSMSSESDAAEYLVRLRNIIEASRNGEPKERKATARKKAGQSSKASRAKTTKKKATKKR
jgi:hypothetical protein